MSRPASETPTRKPADSPPLRLLSFQVDNILRVVAVHVEPNGRVVELTGKNRAGKSSVIDALWMAFGGSRMIPPDPIHDGADEGRIFVELGDDSGLKYSVTRRIKRDADGEIATSLIVENADGAKIQGAATLLKTLVGGLSCDPLDFIAKEPREQFEVLKQFVSGVDFDEIEKANKIDFDERTHVNRDAKARRAQLSAIVVEEKSARIDESALLEQLTQAAEHNAEIDRQRRDRQQMAERSETLIRLAENIDAEVADARRRVAELEAVAAKHRADATNLADMVNDMPALPELIDPTTLRAAIEDARQHNSKVEENERARREHDRLQAEATELERRSAALTDAIDKRNAEKQKAISEAKMPIPGIGFGDGYLLYDGHPLQNASQAQKLQIAIAIAEAAQPRLRFITTKNAALLDEDSWNAMVKMAEEKDLLIIAETVNSDRATAVVIEDGMVRGAQQQAAE